MNFNQLGSYFDKNVIEYQYNPNIERLQFSGNFYGLTLNSLYQPVVSLKEQSIVAHEACIKATYFSEGKYFLLPINELFNSLQDAEQIIYLDRLCRAIHIFNFTEQNYDISSALFLNISSKHLLNVKNQHGEFFKQLLKKYDLNPNQIILEIKAHEFENQENLCQIIRNFHHIGYQITLDNLEINHFNLKLLTMLKPDFIKINYETFNKINYDVKLRRVLKNAIQIIHDLGIQVIVSKIETYQQFMLLEEFNIDLVQGNYLKSASSRVIQSEELNLYDKFSFNQAIGF